MTWLSGQVAAQAGERGLTIATAESCTGGLLGHSLTSIPGSSAFYLGGVIAYADAVKIAHLGVPAATIERHGAVSAQVAVAMAVGIRRSMGSDVGVSVTGIAGPDGGTDAKPVGLTYVAVAGIDGDEVRRHVWTGDRRSNKARGAAAALGLLGATLAASSDPEPDP